MKTRLIGDVHGKIRSLTKILENLPEDINDVIQVGDMGVGFAPHDPRETLEMDKLFLKYNLKFIRGNHDNPAVCKTMKSWIVDGTVLNGSSIFIGGAWSIDHAYRMDGVDWWHDEEISQFKFAQLVDIYDLVMPEVMITHDCPESISEDHFINTGKAMGSVKHTTLTGSALEMMFRSHQPKLQVFGHWHSDLDVIVDGTRFICLDELSYIDVDMKTGEVFGEIQRYEY